MTTKNYYYINIASNIVSYFLLIALFTACNNNNIVSLNDEFNQIEAQIWEAPDIALNSLDAFSYDELNDTERINWNLLHELAISRLGNSGSPDSIMNTVIDFYDKQGLQTHAARAYYVQGLEYLSQSRYFESMQSLKEAERRISFLPDSFPYRCMIFFLEGKIAETEYLFHIANEYYFHALEHATILNDKYRMACCYYNIARTRSEFTDSVAHQYYMEALDIASELNDTLLYYEILIQEEVHNSSIDSVRLYSFAKYLTDTYNDPFYAHYVVEYLQNHDLTKESQYYLDIFSLDSCNSTWSYDQYQYLLSRQENLLGRYKPAYSRLEKLYLNQIDQIYRDGKARTYTISRMYDVEQEKNKNLELTVDKQHLWITIGIIISILIIVILSALYVIYLHKGRERAQAQAHKIEKLKAQAAEEEANKEIDRLNMELELKRVMLRDSLKKRIELSRKMAGSPIDIKSQVQNPSDWLTEWLEENTFINGGNSDKLIAEFQAIYGNLLGNLKKKYPSLTEKDLLFIALSVLGLDVNDIGYIFGTTDRTIWNRRQFIKNRIGNSKMDFEEWIKKLRRKDRKGRA